MSTKKPTYRDLEKRLAAVEPIVEVLRRHEVDAVVGEEKVAFLLLRGVEKALLHSEAELRAMFELPGVGMVQADAPALRFTRVNQKLCEILGYSVNELLTKTYLGLTHPLDQPQDLKALSQVIRGETDSWVIEKRCVRKDGTAIWVSVHGTVLRNEAGQAVSVMAMFSDLTELKNARAAPHDRSAAQTDKPRPKKKTVKKAQTSPGARLTSKPRPKRP